MAILSDSYYSINEFCSITKQNNPSKEKAKYNVHMYALCNPHIPVHIP